ncbi:EGLN protein, partial [Brachypteracias leptosomus]|nr:EGLN protein [Brachypteracias leptosomus]
SLVFHPDPGRAEGCKLQPVKTKPPVTLSYTTSVVPWGCVSNSSWGKSHEVHILNIEWSKVREWGPSTSSWRCHPSTVPTLQGVPARGMCLAPQLRLPLSPQDANLSSETNTTQDTDLLKAIVTKRLLDWARTTYEGITSYSKLQDPRWVQLHLGEDSSSPADCDPQEHFNAKLHLKTEVLFHGMKGCSREDAQSTRAAHIISLQPGPSSPITKVNLTLTCPEKPVREQILILQSQANPTWFLSVNKCHIQLLVSGNYELSHLSSPLIPGENLPDTEQGLVAKAFEKNYSIIASYSAIPTSTHIHLDIQEHGEALSTPDRRTTATPSPLVPTSIPIPNMLLLMLKPWKCTDETMEIIIDRTHLQPIKDLVNITLRDINCQAEKNATHFTLKTPLSHCGTSLESRGQANNELILNLANGAELRSMRVAFQCNIPRELFLRLFPTAAFEGPQTELEVNKEVFVQVPPQAQCRAGCRGVQPSPGDSDSVSPLSLSRQASMRWEDHPADLQLKECWLVGVGVPSSHPQPPPLQNNTIFEKVLEVTVKESWRSPNSHGLGLAAVLGITFGAFLIGALLTAGLWYIYSHTRPISKLQPVSSTAPASESSSTNHSIGSTQSTPCSTSSMA